MFVDSHIHLYDCAQAEAFSSVKEQANALRQLAVKKWCASAHSEKEFVWHEALAQELPKDALVSMFGIHPQQPIKDNFDFLERLAKEKRICAIGEIGFDFFNPKDREREAEQREVWSLQLELAQKYALPIVIHCRKALPLIFTDIKKLKQLRAVVFHGWGFSVVEAQTFLKNGVSAFFSIGKDVLRGKKNTLQTVSTIDARFLLTETDVPYMSSKNEAFAKPANLCAVAQKCAELQGINDFNSEAFERFLFQIEENFNTVFLHK